MSTTMVLPGERARRFDVAGLFAIVLPLVALRVYCASTLAANSDETQHLHVVWAWTRGVVPYRDVFDNHAPLFDLVFAPLLAVLGERADIVAVMRLAMIPLYFAALWLTWYIGRTLWSERTGFLAAAIAATAPIFFVVSVQFRPDDLWMLLWLAAAAVAVSSMRYKMAWAGALVGAAFAVSLKSMLLLAAATLAWLALAAIDRRGTAFAISKRRLIVVALAAAIVPGAFAVGFASVGAWHALMYCLFVHNVVPGLGHWDGSALRLLFPLLGGPLAIAWTVWTKPRVTDERWRMRSQLLLSSVFYLLLLYGCWPLVTHQDLLPVIPLLAIGVAAALAPDDGHRRGWTRILLTVAVVVANALTLVTLTLPRHNELRDQENELARVLQLTRAGDTVMDAKGASVFRERASYWVLEDITEERMRDGSIADDISDRLAATGTPLAIEDRLPSRDAAFVAENYVSAGGLIRVAGKSLGMGKAGQPLAFDIGVPAQYRMIGPAQRPAGQLDGTPLEGPRRLGAGRHIFVPAADSELALVWAPALERGLDPRGFFAVR